MTKKIIAGQVAGRYKFVATKVDGSGSRDLTDWFDNLITENGLNRIGTGGVGHVCMVGAGSTAPTVNDTTLQSLIGATAYILSDVTGAQTTEPYYGWTRRTYRFEQGVAAGNISEVGIGWNDNGTFKVFSRALVVDLLGATTTITVLADEYLDVSYELRMYPPLVDQTGTTVIDGVQRNYVIRASQVTGNGWSPDIILIYGGPSANNTNDIYAVSGPLGLITEFPGGAAESGQHNTSAYSNNSRRLVVNASYTLSQGNFQGGIGVFFLTCAMGRYQISVTPKVAKDATKTLAVSLAFAWARKTI